MPDVDGDDYGMWIERVLDWLNSISGKFFWMFLMNIHQVHQELWALIENAERESGKFCFLMMCN
jgi:hypothetical protein